MHTEVRKRSRLKVCTILALVVPAMDLFLGGLISDLQRPHSCCYGAQSIGPVVVCGLKANAERSILGGRHPFPLF